MSEIFFNNPVVCNTGPILGLARANLTHLLHEVFPMVYIPEAVAAELLAKSTGDRLLIEQALAAAVVVSPGTSADAYLSAELDDGEASVIHLAKEKLIGRVLIDEKKARRVASLVYQLEVRGSAALLLEAKRRSLISKVAPALDAKQLAGYFIGPLLRAECLRRAGE